MPVKRSRVVRSTGCGDAVMVDRFSQTVMESPELRWEFCSGNDSKQPRRSSICDVDQVKPGILTLSSPDIVDECGEGRIDNFLEKCYYCQKRIHENHEVFMYSYLRAFCTSECREIHIAMDKEAKKVSGKSTKTITGQSIMTNVKNQLATGWESIKPQFHL